MSIKQTILNDLKEAMKSGDTLKRDTLRVLDSMVKNAEIEKKKREEGLNDEEIQAVIARAIKQRKDAIEQYKKGGRPELADKEKKEIEILSIYRLQQLGEEEIRKVIQDIIVQTGAGSKTDIGKVMGVAMSRLKGQADGQLVRKIVEEELK